MSKTLHHNLAQRVTARFLDEQLLEKINEVREGSQPPMSPLSERGFYTAQKAVEELKRVFKNVSNGDYKVIAMLHGHDIAK